MMLAQGRDSLVDQAIQARGDEYLPEVVAEHEVLLREFATTGVVVDVAEDEIDPSDLVPFAVGVIKPANDARGA
ncbi:MAG: hypothetical protein ACYSUU_11775, partial [Planctomycetota bacterium]